jgi:hypothetical protein
VARIGDPVAGTQDLTPVDRFARGLVEQFFQIVRDLVRFCRDADLIGRKRKSLTGERLWIRVI